LDLAGKESTAELDLGITAIKKSNTADVIAKGALALTFENHLLLHGVVELIKAFNSHHGLLNLCGSISFFS